jgi:hypothetical protein
LIFACLVKFSIQSGVPSLLFYRLKTRCRGSTNISISTTLLEKLSEKLCLSALGTLKLQDEMEIRSVLYLERKRDCQQPLGKL